MSAIFGEVLRLGQPDGEEIELRVFGDEHYARYETLRGYTVVYDDDKQRFCYARVTSGRFHSTGVEATNPPPAGLRAHMQERPAVVTAKSDSRRLRRAAIARNPETVEKMRTYGPQKGLLEGRILATGKVKGLTILVNFQDVQSTTTKADVEAMLNGAGYTTNGNICSANEYFKRVSSDKLDYTNVVVGPYRLSRNRQFYVNNLLVEEALALAVADGLDLKQFDSRGEGIVDALNVLYAGQTQYTGELWPHNYSIDLVYGNMRTDLYLLTSLGRTPADLSIGTFCHENGHLLCRFPDMYDYGERDGDGTKSAGIGIYCLMGAGNHLDYGRSPAPVSAYLRDLVGWCDNETDLRVAGTYDIKHSDYNRVFKYRTDRPNEYFLVENRAKLGLDRGAPGSGLAVYHCDTDGSNELQEGTPTKHYQCALIQADGLRHLETDVNQGDGTDLFDAVAGVALSASSTPHSRSWDGSDSGLVISAISGPATTMSFKTGTQPSVGVVTGRAEPSVKIPDNKSAGVSSVVAIAAVGAVARVIVKVKIKHTYIGDLRVALTSPTGTRAVLHARQGGAKDDLVETYDSASLGVLANMVGQSMTGPWVLNASDRESRDEGTLVSWELELRSA